MTQYAHHTLTMPFIYILLLHLSLSISDGNSGSFQIIESFVLVHSKEPALSALKYFFEVVPHILFIVFII